MRRPRGEFLRSKIFVSDINSQTHYVLIPTQITSTNNKKPGWETGFFVGFAGGPLRQA